MAFIEWDDSFSLGLEQFDQHHRHLVDLLNKIYDSVMSDNTDECLQEVFTELVAYCDYHFDAEQQYMMTLDYPHMLRHIEAHRKFSQDTRHFQERFHNDQLMVTFALLKYLKDWLISHILDEDKKLVSYRNSVSISSE